MERILERVRAAGAGPRHEQRLLRTWLSGRPLVGASSKPDLAFSRALIESLPEIQAELDALVRVESEHPGEDGSMRMLLSLADGQTVESVLLLRDGLCVSSQVGCAVGCVFCMTGRSGLIRQLRSAEIVAQVAAARRLRKVWRVVFMGMGEPSHNLDAVLEAITTLGTHGDIGHKNLVFSTIGDRRVFKRLLDNPVRPALAISLHTTDAKLRTELVPRGTRMDPAELIALAEDYARAVGHPIQYQWTLIEGVNDTQPELERLTELMQGRHGLVNLIPYNTVEGLEWVRPSETRCKAFRDILKHAGVSATLRLEKGHDIDAACGQLRLKQETEEGIIEAPMKRK
jgi:23S rRNA (adenine2503-C2)-methyltransferase